MREKKTFHRRDAKGAEKRTNNSPKKHLNDVAIK